MVFENIIFFAYLYCIHVDNIFQGCIHNGTFRNELGAGYQRRACQANKMFAGKRSFRLIYPQSCYSLACVAK